MKAERGHFWDPPTEGPISSVFVINFTVYGPCDTTLDAKSSVGQENVKKHEKIMNELCCIGKFAWEF